MALLAAMLFSWAAARSRRQDTLISDNTHTHNLPHEHETECRYTHTHSPNAPQEPRNDNCTEPSRSMGAACRPTGILSCNHTSAAAPLTDSIKIMQPTYAAVLKDKKCGRSWMASLLEQNKREKVVRLSTLLQGNLSLSLTDIMGNATTHIVMWMQFHSCLCDDEGMLSP